MQCELILLINEMKGEINKCYFYPTLSFYVQAAPQFLSMENLIYFQANSHNCVNNTAYCWMNCLELPPGCALDDSVCYNIDHSPCNTINEDPPHDVTCAWHCKNPDSGSTKNLGTDTAN